MMKKVFVVYAKKEVTFYGTKDDYKKFIEDELKRDSELEYEFNYDIEDDFYNNRHWFGDLAKLTYTETEKDYIFVQFGKNNYADEVIVSSFEGIKESSEQPIESISSAIDWLESSDYTYPEVLKF